MKGQLLKTRLNCKALALVVVLWIVMLLAVITATMIRSALLGDRVSLSSIDKAKCSFAVRAGVETAIAVLLSDENQTDTLLDDWAVNIADFNDIMIGDCAVTIDVTDEASKLNINTITAKQLMKFDEMTQEIADCVLDWRDEDSKQREQGAENEYYQQLQIAYQIRNAQFRTIRELLFVRGVNEELLFGEDINFNEKLDIAENDGEESLPLDNADSVLDKGWISLLSCHSLAPNENSDGEAKINIKSEDEKSLAKKLSISNAQAKWIKEKTGDKKFKKITDLIDDKSPKKAQKNKGKKDNNKSEILDLETFKSIVDRITVTDDSTIAGKVNINTASEKVLKILFDGETSLVEEVVRRREKEENGLTSLSELFDMKGMNVNKFKKVADHVCFRSSVYFVRCKARANATQMQYYCEAIIERKESNAEILYWYEGITN